MTHLLHKCSWCIDQHKELNFKKKEDYATKSGVWRLYIGCLEHFCFMNKFFGWFVFISYYTCIHFFSFTIIVFLFYEVCVHAAYCSCISKNVFIKFCMIVFENMHIQYFFFVHPKYGYQNSKGTGSAKPLRSNMQLSYSWSEALQERFSNALKAQEKVHKSRLTLSYF